LILAPLLRGRSRLRRTREDMEKLNREGLFHPMLFCEQEKREARFLQHVWTESCQCQADTELRQSAVLLIFQIMVFGPWAPWWEPWTRGQAAPGSLSLLQRLHSWSLSIRFRWSCNLHIMDGWSKILRSCWTPPSPSSTVPWTS
jgi:hypothetical protein